MEMLGEMLNSGCWIGSVKCSKGESRIHCFRGRSRKLGRSDGGFAREDAWPVPCHAPPAIALAHDASMRIRASRKLVSCGR